MTACFMRQDFFDFIPKFKLFVTGNHKPQLSNVDEAMRRRRLLVPFTVQIPVEERDPQLPEKLKAEWPAILRWCLDGCLEWQRIGLAPPQIVTDATEAYFDDQDLIKQWLDECTQEAPSTVFTGTPTLFSSWKNWCDERGMSTGTARALSDALSDRGLMHKRTKRGRGFAGIELRSTKGGDAW
jgi:putative DNA primase/helicase